MAYAQSGIQNKNAIPKWYIGLNGGANIFFGDIKYNSFWPEPKMQEIQAGGGFVFGRKLSPALSMSTEFNFTSLKGKQVVLPDTLGFKTQALSFALKGQLNAIALLGKKNARFAFIVESGAGIIGWRSLLQNFSTQDTLNNLGWLNSNEEFAFYIPAGIKFEYQFSPKFSSYLASSYNLVFSDLLDGQVAGNIDSHSYTALGFNYFFGKQKEVPKLLPYDFFEIEYDSLAAKTVKDENKTKNTKAIIENINPYSLNFVVPETAPHTEFSISLIITKKGIPATGFFRLLVPSGFLPQPAPNKEVSFTKLGHRYEYDFILPMNQDSTIIPIQIDFSEIEKNTYPILIEGEIMDKNNKVYPIKFAKYVKIISEDEWYQGLSIKDKKILDAKKLPEKTEIATTTIINEKTSNSLTSSTLKVITPKENSNNATDNHEVSNVLKGVYRIQLMASKEPYPNLQAYKDEHKITDEIFVAEADGWYRYNLYAAENRKEAIDLCLKVRKENDIPQAFVTYYENGKRVIKKQEEQIKKETSPSKEISSQKVIAANQSTTYEQKETPKELDHKLIYRIEIAQAFEQPIPLYLLQNKVGKEIIREFSNDKTFYYTIGEFEDLAISKGFLEYVKSQLKLENAKIVQYQNNKRVKVVN